MTDQSDENDRRQRQVSDKIDAQEKRMFDASGTDGQRASDQQLLNEMRGNKASVDLNRALGDPRTFGMPTLLMSFLIKSSTPSSTFTAGAYDAHSALFMLDRAKADGRPNLVCTDENGRTYSHEELIRLAKLPST